TRPFSLSHSYFYINTHSIYHLSPLYISISLFFSFFFNDPAPTDIYTLSLHDAFRSTSPRSFSRYGTADSWAPRSSGCCGPRRIKIGRDTSELQSRGHLVCRLLLEKKKKINTEIRYGVKKNTRKKQSNCIAA